MKKVILFILSFLTVSANLLALEALSDWDKRASDSFNSLGPVYQIGDYFLLSDVVAESRGGSMTERDAEKFCSNLGEGYQLPSYRDWSLVAKAMGALEEGSSAGYDATKMENMRGQIFWSRTPAPAGGYSNYTFNGTRGKFGWDIEYAQHSVRCVFKLPGY